VKTVSGTVVGHSLA